MISATLHICLLVVILSDDINLCINGNFQVTRPWCDERREVVDGPFVSMTRQTWISSNPTHATSSV